eukprot:4749692-Prymnesium_polylepis.1
MEAPSESIERPTDVNRRWLRPACVTVAERPQQARPEHARPLLGARALGEHRTAAGRLLGVDELQLPRDAVGQVLRRPTRVFRGRRRKWHGAAGTRVLVVRVALSVTDFQPLARCAPSMFRASAADMEHSETQERA